MRYQKNLKDEYAKYKSSEYTDDKWIELVNAKNKGLDEIYKATSIDSVTLAMTNAIAAMERIEKKSITGDIPDFGDILLYRFAKIKGLDTEINGNIELFADK